MYKYKRKRKNIILKLLFSTSGIFIIIFLLIPVAYIIIWSFTGKEGEISLTSDFTFYWFNKVLTDSEWLRAIGTSLFYAFSSTFISLLLVLIYYYYSLWYKKSYRFIGHIIISIPLFFPLLVYALALKMISAKFEVPEALGIIMGHVCILIPVQYFILDGSNEKVKMDWLYSSTVMGSTHLETVRNVLLPNIKLTLLVALACGFLYSFDETVISNFLIDSRNITIPKKIWLEIDTNISPSAGVVYTMLLLVNLPIIISIIFYKKIKIAPSMRLFFQILKTFMFRDVKASIKSGLIAAFIAFLFELLAFHEVSYNSLFATILIAILLFIIFEFLFQILSWGYDIIDLIYLFRKERS